MRNGEGIRLVIEFAVDDAARFTEMAEAMVAVSKTEDGTVVYDWYLDAEAGVGMLYEAYTSYEAILEHVQGAVFTELAPKYQDAMKVVKVDAFGDTDRIAANGNVLGAPTRFWGASIAAVSN